MRYGPEAATILLLAAVYGPSAHAEEEATSGLESPVQEDRVEYGTADRERFHVVGLGRSGFLVVYAEESVDQGRTWKIHLHDADFEVRWTGVHARQRKQELLAHDIDSSSVYLLLVRKNKFELLEIDRDGGGLDTIRGTLPSKFTPVQFKVHRELAWLGGSVKKGAHVLAISLDRDDLRQYPIDLEGQSTVKGIRTDERQQHVHVSIHNTLEKNNTVFVFDYTAEGEEIARYHLESDDERWELTDAQLHHVDTGGTIALGTYMSSAKRTASELLFDQKRGGAQGIFFAQLDADGNAGFTYHGFNDFENFFAYLPEKKRSKREKKIEEKQEAGSEPRLRSAVLLHDPISRNGAHVVIGEVHHPVYHTTPGSYNASTGTWSGGSTSYLGETYTHAIVVGLDGNGDKLWDHCFKMDKRYSSSGRLLSDALRERVAATFEDDTLSLLYVSGEVIKSLVIAAGVAADEIALTKIESGDRSSDVYDAAANVAYWYGSSYLMWGHQVFTRDRPLKKRQRTYFVSRVGFEPPGSAAPD